MTKKFKVTNMHCTSCAAVIEGELEDCGAKSAKCNYATQLLEVECDDSELTEEKISAILNKAGYSIAPTS